jgi:hypothetical protein
MIGGNPRSASTAKERTEKILWCYAQSGYPGR